MSLKNIQGLVALIQANGGAIDSRIRLQKQVYLLKWLGYPNFADMRFSYHHFGPYSRDMADDVHNAVLDGLVEERFESFENDYTRYSYRVTGKGLEICPEPLDDGCRQFVGRMRDCHWRELELGATALFLERDEKLSPDAAFQRALQLKPACEPYSAQARELIEALRLHRDSDADSTAPAGTKRSGRA